MERLTAAVHGYVQGVSFRYYAWREAERLGLRGRVRNQADGTVLLVAEGNGAALREMVAWLERGSPAARVERVESHFSGATGEFDSFRIMGW